MITSLLKWFVLSVALPTIGESATNATLSAATVVARMRVGRNAVQPMCVQIVGKQTTAPKPLKHHRRGVEARGAIESKNTSTKLYLPITIPESRDMQNEDSLDHCSSFCFAFLCCAFDSIHNLAPDSDR
jgi:hypothetical protein